MTSTTSCLTQFVNFHRALSTSTPVGNGCLEIQHSLCSTVIESALWGFYVLKHSQTTAKMLDSLSMFKNTTKPAMLMVALVNPDTINDVDSTIEHRITWVKDGENGVVYKVHGALFSACADLGYPVRYDKVNLDVDLMLLSAFESTNTPWIESSRHVKAYKQLLGLHTVGEATMERIVSLGVGKVVNTKVVARFMEMRSVNDLYQRLLNPLVVPQVV